MCSTDNMDEYNDDETVPPIWLNEEFLQMVLRQYEKDDSILVKDLIISPGSGKGDHLASIMFRAVTSYSSKSGETNSRSMIIKTLPEEGFKKEMLENLAIFDTEIKMYTEEVPKFEKILREHGDDTRLCAKILYYSLKPRKVIVFEDLVAAGYSCIRDRLPTEEEVRLCFEKIANWHAVSYKLASEGDESVKGFVHGLLSEPKEKMSPFIKQGLEFLHKTLSKIEGMQMYAEKLQALEAVFMDKCIDLFQAHSRGHKAIMVLNHGDFHFKNMMFKFGAEKKAEDVMMVDFQMSVYAPAVIDITYALGMMCTEDMRKNKREELIYFYFSTFLKTLKAVGYEGELPTLVDFYIDLYRFKEFDLWVTATFLPMVHFVVSKGMVQADKLVSGDTQTNMYTTPSYINELKWRLPRYLYNGYLD